MITLVVGAALATSTSPADATAVQKAKDPARVVKASNDAFNRGDVAATVAYYARDAELFTPLGGCNPCTGRDVIATKYGPAIANQTKVTFGRLRVRGATVTADGELRSAALPPGVERAVGAYTWTVRKGKIVRLRAKYDRNDPQTAALLNAIEQATPPSSAG